MAKKTTDLPLTETVSTQINSVGYQGKVTFKVMHGNKVLSAKKYLNQGLPDLFKYLSYALAGTYTPAMRPCKIALFYCNEDSHSPANFKWSETFDNNTLLEVSPYVVYDSTPVVKATDEGYATTFRFKIPYNWLYKKTFNVIGLFAENNQACAFYLCTTDAITEDGTKYKAWEAVELDDITGNFSLLVEWVTEISNQIETSLDNEAATQNV